MDGNIIMISLTVPSAHTCYRKVKEMIDSVKSHRKGVLFCE